jgi:PPIC-type PPIASE domain
VKEEIYYREAKALGLDANDTVVRQRMRLKMDMLNDVAVDRLSPTDDELSAYLAAHAEMFRTEPAAAFDQVYFSPDKRGDALAADAAEQLQALQAGAAADFAALGDATQLPASLKLTPRSGIARDFGDQFAAAIMDLPVGVWSGPVPSGYGIHLVRVDARDAGRAPALADVRDQVVSEWKSEKRKEFEDRRLAEFATHYDVVVARDPGPGQ